MNASQALYLADSLSIIVTMKKLLFIVGMLAPFAVVSQAVSGTVTNKQGEPLIGASVYWAGTSIGVSTNDTGTYNIFMADIEVTNRRLVFSYVGHLPDTINITDQTRVDVKLSVSGDLDEVVIKGRQNGVIISDFNPIKTEQLTQIELMKAACCDLAGCFETQSTVQAQTTNVITNSKELRILGLSGVYNQVLIDGFPMIQGLSHTYGISSLPGTLVENIFISKGANSVLQGYESISGQINVITQDPSNTDKFLLNGYVNNFEEKHINANYAFTKGKWSNLTAVHTVQPAQQIDKDGDQFMDLPLLTRYMLFNKWKYGNAAEWGWHSEIGIRYTNEQRIGGQLAFNPKTDKGSTNIYGQSVKFEQPEFWTKAGYRFDDTHSIKIFASGFYQNQNSFFGTVGYDADQTNFYSSIQYDLNYGNSNLKTGFSYRHLNLNEIIDFSDTALDRNYAGDYSRLENVPGFFAENTMRLFNDKLTWIVGIRGDHHNQFGLKAAPRALIKYDIRPRTILRANVGLGWRTVNLFSENINLLVSSRDILIVEQLEPEQAMNYGINLTQKFNTSNENLSGYFSVDFYRTDFQNQIFPDYDADPTQAIIQNFEGTSISNGFQAEIFVKLWQRFYIKSGYNFLDVYRMNGDVKEVLPFNARHRVMASFGYQPLSNRFHIDMNMHRIGSQRLPNTQSSPIEFQRPDFSEAFTLVNAQFTYNFKQFEVYAGCENIFDFRQKRPIISWQNPFSQYFDTSSVWGPTRGRETYIGFRYRLGN